MRGKAHFCFTTWWGQRLLLNLSAGSIVSDSSEFEPELVKTEKTFVLATLQAASLWKYDLNRNINPGLAKDSPGPAVQDVLTALLMAAKLKVLEAVPSVRRLESCPIVLTTAGGQSQYRGPDGGIRPAVYHLTVRQTAQLCLRRLGLRPSSHQSTRIYRGGSYWQPEDPLPFQRETRVQDPQGGDETRGSVSPYRSPRFHHTSGVGIRSRW